MVTEGKGKIGQPIVAFSFSLSFLINDIKVENIGRMYAYQEVKQN